MTGSSGELKLEISDHTLQESSDAPPAELRVGETGKLKVWLWRALLLLLSVALWEIAATLGWINDFLFGHPLGIWEEFVRMLTSGQLARDTWATFYGTIVGFAIGMTTGSLVGLALWYSSLVGRLVEPVVVALNGLPKIALAPLIIVWFGSGITSKFALAGIGTFIVAVINVYEGTRQADKDLMQLVLSMGGSKYDVFRKIVVPSTVPWIISTLRINIGVGLLATIGGEFVGSDRGLGRAAFISGYLFNLNAVWVSIFTLMALALILYTLIIWLEKKLSAWLPAGRARSAT